MNKKRGGRIEQITSYSPPKEEWLNFLYHNTYYGGAKLPLLNYAKKKYLFTKQRIALLAITLLVFIPLLAAFAGEGLTYQTDSTTTGIAGAEGRGETYEIVITTNPYQGVTGAGSGGTYSMGSGFLPGNRRPTHTAPILNNTDELNRTKGTLNCYNQTTADADSDKITNRIMWFRSETLMNILENSTSVASTNLQANQEWICQIEPSDGTEYGIARNSTSMKIIAVSPIPEPGGARGTIGVGSQGSYERMMAERVECLKDRDCAEDEKCIDKRCVKLFDIQILRADSPVEATDILDFTYLMKGMGEIDGDVIVEYWLQKPFTDKKVVRGQDAIYVKPWQTKIEDASLYLTKDLEGEYELVVKLTYEGYTVEAIRTIEIVEKAPLILTTNLIEFDPPIFKLKIGTNKDKEIAVNLEETVTKDNQIMWQDKKQVPVKRTLDIEESLITLPAGTYTLKIVAEAEGKTTELTRVFTLEQRLVVEQPGQLGWLKNIFLMLLYGVGILGALILLFYTGRTMIRHDITVKGRQKVSRELTGMRKRIQKLKKKGFDTRRMENMLKHFRVKEMKFRQLRNIAVRTGEIGKKTANKAGDAGERAIDTAIRTTEFGKETLAKVGELGAGAGVEVLEQTKKATDKALSTLHHTKDSGIDVLDRAKETTEHILEASGETLTTLEKNLLGKIKYWHQRGREISILQRKLKKLKKKQAAMPTPPKPVITPRVIPKPKIVVKPKIVPKKIPKIKPKIVHKPKIPKLKLKPIPRPKLIPVKSIKFNALEHKIKQWKKLGYDTKVLESRLRKAAKKPIAKLKKDIEIKPVKPKKKVVTKITDSFKKKIALWKNKGYDTTLLEQKLREAQTKKTIIKKELKPRFSEKKILDKIAEWKAKGYNTKLLEKQLTRKEDHEVKIKALEDKVKLWKKMGYDTLFLEQKVKLLKKRRNGRKYKT